MLVHALQVSGNKPDALAVHYYGEPLQLKAPQVTALRAKD